MEKDSSSLQNGDMFDAEKSSRSNLGMNVVRCVVNGGRHSVSWVVAVAPWRSDPQVQHTPAG